MVPRHLVRDMRIIDLYAKDEEAVRQAAALLVDGFRENWPEAWPDMGSALEEVHRSFGADRISLVAVDDKGRVLGWIGGMRQYRGRVWELHPLVVLQEMQRRGIGRTLVADLAQRVRERGGLTIWVGTDDEANMTTLAGRELYPNVLEKLGEIRNLRGHPYEFYQRLGFVTVGVRPDANGPGKPDIFLAKSVWR